MRKTKAVLIVGASSFVGTHMALKLRKKYKVFASFFQHKTIIPGTTPIPLDVFEKNWVKRVVYSIKPEIVIYAAGRNDVEWAEDGRMAERIHAGGAASVCAATSILQPRFILLSNSYVFDGQKGNYREKDILLPQTDLGKAKISSENYVKARSLNYVVVRSAPLFGRGNAFNPSFVDQLRIALCRGQRIEVPHDELHSFAPVSTLVDFVERLIEGAPRNSTFHFGGLTKVSYYEFAQRFADRFGFDRNLILKKNQRGTTSPPEKPLFDYSLNCSEAASKLKVNPVILEKGFDLFEKEIRPQT